MHIVPPVLEDPMRRVYELLQGQTHDYIVLQVAVPGYCPCIVIIRLKGKEIARGEGDSQRTALELAARAALPGLEQRHRSRRAQHKSLLNPEKRLTCIFRYRMDSFLDWVIEYRLPTPKERKRDIRFILATKKYGSVYITIKERMKNDNAGYFLWSPRTRVTVFVPHDPYMSNDELFDRFHKAFQKFYTELSKTPLLALV